MSLFAINPLPTLQNWACKQQRNLFRICRLLAPANQASTVTFSFCPEIYLLPIRTDLLILNLIFAKPPTYPKHRFVTQIASSEISLFLVSFSLSYCIQSTRAHTPLDEALIIHWNELSPTDITNDSQSQQLCDRHSTQTIRFPITSSSQHIYKILFLLFLLYKGEEKYTSKNCSDKCMQLFIVTLCIMAKERRQSRFPGRRLVGQATAQMLENAF